MNGCLKKEYQTIEDILKSSPLFNLSMSSKELFYSNFIFWISIKYPQIFISILNYLGIETIGWPETWIPYREKNDFDLSIEDQNGNILLILENKIKSIPYKEQLDKYENAVIENGRVQFVLLSLARSFPFKDDIQDKWKIINFKQLSDAVFINSHNIHDIYHLQLLIDFCNVCKTLDEIQSTWIYNDNMSYLQHFVYDAEVEDNLRISDVRKKILYSHLAMELQQTMKCHIKTNKEIINISKNGKSNVGDTYINWGMTRSSGLIDIKIRIRGNLLLGIQLQGAIYKHYIESLDRQDLAIINSISSQITNKERVTIYDNNIIKNIFETKFIQDGERTFEGYPLTESHASKPNSKDFNKYGDEFIYQYIKIKQETTVKFLKDAIIRDYNSIITKILI